MHRMFVALRPPIDIRRRLIDLMGGISAARWQDDDQLHITLRYIGEVDGRVAEDVASALAAVRAPPVSVMVEGVGVFADRHRPGGAVWAGIRPLEAITRLHHKVDHALVRAGLGPERRAYLPHITLARLPRTAAPPNGFLATQAGLVTDSFVIDHMLLFESHLSAAGATYDAVARYPLTA